GWSLLWWQDQSSRSQPAPAVTTLDQIEVEAADGTTEIHLLERDEEPLELDQSESLDSQAEAAPAQEQSEPEQPGQAPAEDVEERKSTRLNSSHVKISYAVFCLKKKKNTSTTINRTT